MDDSQWWNTSTAHNQQIDMEKTNTKLGSTCYNLQNVAKNDAKMRTSNNSCKISILLFKDLYFWITYVRTCVCEDIQK